MFYKSNIKTRILYFSLTFAVYSLLMESYGLKQETIDICIFVTAGIGLYLSDTLNFKKDRFKISEMVYPAFISLGMFIILAIHKSNPKIIFMTVPYIVADFLFRKLLVKLNKNEMKTVVIGLHENYGKIMENLNKARFKDLTFVPLEGDIVTVLKKEIEERGVNNLILGEKDVPEKLLNYLLHLKFSGIRMKTLISVMESSEGKVNHKMIDKKWIVESDGFSYYSSDFQQKIKRLFDIVLSLSLGIVVLPIVLLSAVIVRLESPGPVFFKQKRTGLDGKDFEIIKFRSMKLHNQDEHSKYAGKNDNRITPYGKFMRKARIDELPQLWMILKGDMSFVGPRPEWNLLCKEYREIIGEIYDIRHTVKPGVTGWAQVMYPYGAGVEDAIKKLEYDIYYVKNQNLVLDMVIFAKTFKTVLQRKGM